MHWAQFCSLIVAVLLTLPSVAQEPDPLPSWNAGTSKAAIVDFVRRVTTPGTPDYVPLEDRIATFDNDGTLWSEQPFYFQLQFAIDRIRKLASKHPEWKSEQPFKAALEGDMESLIHASHEGRLKLVMASHAGMTIDEFASIAREWLKNAEHPRFGRPYTDLVYQPMLELLSYLRANGFRTYITSGGGVEFLRVFAEELYGIPPEQVIGSSSRTKFEIRNGTPVLVRLPELNFIDDGEGKPVGIYSRIGRRPIAAFGNSDGDLQMLQWTAAGKGARFCLIVSHTDSVREWAYGRDSQIGRLDKALDTAAVEDWTVVDMKSDWNTIYPFQRSDHHYFHSQEQDHVAAWSYAGKNGPEHWGTLAPSYRMASRGRQQSPIDIRSAAPAKLPELNFRYKPSTLHLVYNGHTVQENEDAGSVLRGPQRDFRLKQFHFHSPSEHTLNGHQFPMEMHLVHKADDGTVGVVAVLFRTGRHNKALDRMWQNLPTADNPKRESTITINAMDLLPDSHRYYHYQGSFTTPPCTEHVEWMVLTEPVELSDEQITRFRAIIDGNNRPVQPLNGRLIQVSQ